MIVETAVIATVEEIGKKVFEEGVKVIGNEIGKVGIERIEIAEIDEMLNSQFGENIDLNKPPECMKDFKLFQEIEATKENPELRMAFINKVLSESGPLKGQLGEAFAHKNIENTFGGEIESQVVSGANRLDYLVGESKNNVELKMLEIKDGEISNEILLIAKGKSVAIEIKNGIDTYLKSEVNSGHVLDQIAEGKKIADLSLVGIRQDVAESMIKNQNMIEQVQKIQENGGKIVIFLPSEAVQVVKLMEAIK